MKIIFFNIMTETTRSDWIQSRNSSIYITWRDVSVFVKIKQRKFFDRNSHPYKKLINNVTGLVKGGNLVVLMGPR